MTVGGTPVPVLAASASELKVLVTKDVDTGPVKVKIGSRTGIGPYDFAVKGYPGGGDDGPPVFAMGAGAGEAGDVNPIGTVRVLVVVCQAADKIPANLAKLTNWPQRPLEQRPHVLYAGELYSDRCPVRHCQYSRGTRRKFLRFR